MHYRLLGPLQVVDDHGNPVPVPAPKRRALLSVLLLHANETVSVGSLVEALWGADAPPAAIPSLRAHISRLRKEIGAVVATNADGYTIQVDPGAVDMHEFTEHVAVARRLAHAGQHAQASETYRRSLKLWHGTALADVADEPFARPQATRLEELRLAVLEERIESDLALNRHEQVVDELEAMVSEHPLRERAWGQLMRALYGSGRQADALTAYRRLRSTLQEELGIDPSPDIQELQIRILQQDPSLVGLRVFAMQPVVQLPAPLTGLTGRAAELALATAVVRDHRLLTLTGPGGVGKTRLALAVAQALIEEYPDGVLFVDLSGIRDPMAVMAGIGVVTGGGDRPAAVIRARAMLLLLDNFEQVIDAADQVAALAQACPNLHLLVTSRVPLRIRGEQTMEVLPLQGADAVALFEERGRAALYASALSAEDAGEIVARLDGLPLAIELAAARLRAMSPAALREGLRERLPLLDGGFRDAPQRHQTLRETIAWSYELLSHRSQKVFRACGAFPSTFDFAAAEAVAGADAKSISDLVDHSLIRHTGDRYSMLDTIREFAAAEADVCGETTVLRDRHLAHFLGLARSIDRERPAAGPMVDNPWLVACRTERDNFRVAFDWAALAANHIAVHDFIQGVGLFWLITGAVEVGERWTRAALDVVGALDRRAQVRLLSIASEFPRYGGDPEQAIDLKRRGLELARSIELPVMVATLLDDLASVLGSQGEYPEAHACLAEALPIRHRYAREDPIGVPHTLSAMAELALREGDAAEAARLVREMVAAEASIDRHPDLVVESNWLVARSLLASGEIERAADRFQAMLAEAGELAMLWPFVDGLNALACIAAIQSAAEAARLIGMADRMQAESRLAAWDPDERERTIAHVRSQLGDEQFERLRAEGHALSTVAIARAAASAELLQHR